MTRDKVRTCIFRPYRKGMGPVFTLTSYDAGRRYDGKNGLAYTLRAEGKTIFEGDDFACSPFDAIDSDGAIACLMGFLTLRPGDTDSEYFENYTPEQLEFCALHAEALGAEVSYRFGEDR